MSDGESQRLDHKHKENAMTVVTAHGLRYKVIGDPRGPAIWMPPPTRQTKKMRKPEDPSHQLDAGDPWEGGDYKETACSHEMVFLSYKIRKFFPFFVVQVG